MENFTDKKSRTGNLRADGIVHLWKAGARVGRVVIEEYCDGQYQRLGG
jgi:hypothetical protein